MFHRIFFRQLFCITIEKLFLLTSVKVVRKAQRKEAAAIQPAQIIVMMNSRSKKWSNPTTDLWYDPLNDPYAQSNYLASVAEPNYKSRTAYLEQLYEN